MAVISMCFLLSNSAAAMNLSEGFSFDFEFTLDFDLITAGATIAAEEPVVDSTSLGGLTLLDSPTTFTAPAPSVLEVEPTSSQEPVLQSEPLPPTTVQTTTQDPSFSFDGEPTFSFRQFTGEAAPTSTVSEPAGSFEPVFTIPEITEPTPDPVTTTTTELPSTFTFTPTFNFLSLNFNFDLESLDFNLAERTTTPTTSQPTEEEETTSEPTITVQLANLEFDAEPETSTSPATTTTAGQSLSFSGQSAAAISPQQTTSQPETLLTECTTNCPTAGDKVPEPGTLLLLGFGIVGVMRAGRRRKPRNTTLTPHSI